METKNEKFEEKFQELEKIVGELESGNTDLDLSIEKYTKAMKLAKECGDKLTAASEKVNKILDEDGKLKDFDITE